MTVTVDISGLRQAVIDRNTQVADDAVQAMFLDMEANAPRDTGAMTQTMTVEVTDSGDRHIGRHIAAPAEYASYQDEGTGVYGPEGTPIVPTNGKVLAFYWRKTGKVEFRASVLGSPATHWWSDRVSRWADYVAEAQLA